MHERLLRFIRNDCESSFYDTLSTVNEKTIHQRCINILLTEVCKYLDGFSQELMNEVFYLLQNHHNLNILNVFTTDNPHKNFFIRLYFLPSNSTMKNTILRS